MAYNNNNNPYGASNARRQPVSRFSMVDPSKAGKTVDDIARDNANAAAGVRGNPYGGSAERPPSLNPDYAGPPPAYETVRGGSQPAANPAGTVSGGRAGAKAEPGTRSSKKKASTAGRKDGGNESAIAPWVALLAIVVVGGGCYWWMSSSNDAVGVVVGSSWERRVSISVLRDIQKEGWSVPAGASVLRQDMRLFETKVERDSEVRCRTETVEVGVERVYVRTDTTCYNDGTCDNTDVFEDRPVIEEKEICDERHVDRQARPDYRPYYVYTVAEWVKGQDAVASGTTGSAPYWPSVSAGPTLRETGRREKFKVDFQMGHDQGHAVWSYAPRSVDEWRRFAVEGIHVLTYNSFSVVKVD